MSRYGCRITRLPDIMIIYEYNEYMHFVKKGDVTYLLIAPQVYKLHVLLSVT